MRGGRPTERLNDVGDGAALATPPRPIEVVDEVASRIEDAVEELHPFDEMLEQYAEFERQQFTRLWELALNSSHLFTKFNGSACCCTKPPTPASIVNFIGVACDALTPAAVIATLEKTGKLGDGVQRLEFLLCGPADVSLLVRSGCHVLAADPLANTLAGVSGTALTLVELLRVLVHVNAALRFLHHRRICHGAITLENIVVDRSDGTITAVKLRAGNTLRYTADLAELHPQREESGELSPTLDIEDPFFAADMRQLGRVVFQLLHRDEFASDEPDDADIPRLVSDAANAVMDESESESASALRQLLNDLPRLLSSAERPLSAWRLDAFLVQWAVLDNFGLTDLATPLANPTHLEATVVCGISNDGVSVADCVSQMMATRDLCTSESIADAFWTVLSLQDADLPRVNVVALCRVLMSSVPDPGMLLTHRAHELSCFELAASRDLDMFTMILDIAHQKGTLQVEAHLENIHSAIECNKIAFVDALLCRWYAPDLGCNKDWEVAFTGFLSKLAQSGLTNSCLLQLRIAPTCVRDRAVRGALRSGAGSVACEALLKAVVEDKEMPAASVREIATVALFFACENNLVDLVKAAVASRARSVAFDATGSTCVHHAAKLGHEAAMRELFTLISTESVSNLVALVDADGRTPLHLAASNGHKPTGEFLIESGADANAADRERCTPIHLAAQKGDTAVCNLLLEKDAWAEPKLLDGSTPMKLAATEGSVECIKCIRDALMTNGCLLAAEWYPASCTPYETLLRHLKRVTSDLNQIESFRRIKLLLVLATLYPAAVAGAVVSLAELGVSPTNYWILAAVIVYPGAMWATRQSGSVPGVRHRTTVLLDSLRPIRSLLQSLAIGLPPSGLKDAKVGIAFTTTLPGRLSRLRHQLSNWSARSDAVAELRVSAAVVVSDVTLWAQQLLPAPHTTASPNNQSPTIAADHALTAAANSALREITLTFNPNVDPVRLLAKRQLLHSVLYSAEADPNALEFDWNKDEWWNYAKVVARVHGPLFVLRAVSTIVMITLFATLTVTMFTKAGAVAFHFSSELADRCADKEALRCTDFLTAMDWIHTTNADCCFGATDAMAECPGSISSLAPVMLPTPPPSVGAPTTPTDDPANALIVPIDATRTVYLRSAAHGRDYPTTKITVATCTLRHPQPRVVVNTILRDGRVSDASRIAGAFFLNLAGLSLIIAESAVAYRWAHRRRDKYQMAKTSTYAVSLGRFLVLATLHATVATLCCIIANRVLRGVPLSELVDVALAAALLSTFPGLLAITLLPKVGPIVAPYLRTAFFGLLFAFSVVSLFRIIPAIESFSIPFYVTDPQRAIVSFSDVTSSYALYVAICVLWVLLGSGIFIAALRALAPTNDRERYAEFFWEPRAMVKDKSPRLVSWYVPTHVVVVVRMLLCVESMPAWRQDFRDDGLSEAMAHLAPDKLDVGSLKQWFPRLFDGTHHTPEAFVRELSSKWASKKSPFLHTRKHVVTCTSERCPFHRREFDESNEPVHVVAPCAESGPCDVARMIADGIPVHRPSGKRGCCHLCRSPLRWRRHVEAYAGDHVLALVFQRGTAVTASRKFTTTNGRAFRLVGVARQRTSDQSGVRYASDIVNDKDGTLLCSEEDAAPVSSNLKVGKALVGDDIVLAIYERVRSANTAAAP